MCLLGLSLARQCGAMRRRILRVACLTPECKNDLLVSRHLLPSWPSSRSWLPALAEALGFVGLRQCLCLRMQTRAVAAKFSSGGFGSLTDIPALGRLQLG